MIRPGTHERKSRIASFCCASDGEIQSAQLGWQSESLQAVCIVDYADRERNPYHNLWGVTFFEQDTPVSNSGSNLANSDPYITIEVVGGSLADLVELPELTPPDETRQLGWFHRLENIKTVPANLSWRDDPPHMVGVRDPSRNKYPQYGNPWQIVFPGNPAYEFGPFPDGLAATALHEPYLSLRINETFQQSFHSISSMK